MPEAVRIIFIIICLLLSGCGESNPNAVELSVEFSWEGLVPCTPGGNPEISVGGIPAETKTLVVKLTDHGMSHGKQTLVYDGTGIIKKGALDEIEGPCPQFDPGRYRFKVAALDGDGVVLGVGSKERYFPEEK